MKHAPDILDAFYFAFSASTIWVTRFRADPSEVAHATAHQVSEILTTMAEKVEQAGADKAIEVFLAEEAQYLGSPNVKSHQKLLLSISLQKLRQDMTEKGYALPTSEAYSALNFDGNQEEVFLEMRRIIEKTMEFERKFKQPSSKQSFLE